MDVEGLRYGLDTRGMELRLELKSEWIWCNVNVEWYHNEKMINIILSRESKSFDLLLRRMTNF